MNSLIEALRGGLIVSCQAYPGEPMNTPETMRLVALEAEAGGAVAIRAQGLTDVALIAASVGVPVIGLVKEGADGVYITPTLDLALRTAQAGAAIVAVDGTRRPRPDGLALAEVVRRFRAAAPGVALMADCGSLDDALAAQAAGVDVLGTTLAGYTLDRPAGPGPDFELLDQMVAACRLPVILEGRVWEPDQAAKALRRGAHAVCVGSAITHPLRLTRRFAAALAPAEGRSLEGVVPDGARLTEPVTAPTPAAAGVTAVASALAPVAAADIGGTKIAVALVTPDGALLTEPVTAPTPAAAGAAGVIQRTVELLRPLVADGAGLVGVSSAGVIDSDTGAVVGATDHIAGWAGTALGPELAQALGCPVRVLGDGHAFAVGEAAFGAGHGLDSVLVVAVGSGVGGSYVRHGRPLTGSHWAGGHLGHVAVPQAEGLPCLCGRTGHVEAVASGWGLLANYRRLGGDRAVPSAKEVCELAGSDSLARQAVETAGAALGAAVGGLANVLDPALVIVAGSLTGAGPLWEAALRGAYLDNLMPVIEQTPLSLAQAGTWPALRGAALYATLVVG